MAKKVTLNPLGNGVAKGPNVDYNLDLLNSALDNTISRDGSGPNQMEADLDLNGYQILNVTAIYTDAIRTPDGFDLTEIVEQTKEYAEIAQEAAEEASEKEASMVAWRGPWTPNTTYRPSDLVSHQGTTYVCIQLHTAGSSWNPINWSVFAAKGDTGAGTGDMLSSIYDTLGAGVDVYNRINHVGTQPMSTISDLESFRPPAELSTWIAGTDNTERSISPAKLATTILNEVNLTGIGRNGSQRWRVLNASRSPGVTYINDTGLPIMVSVRANANGAGYLRVSHDNNTWIDQGIYHGTVHHQSTLVPINHYYRVDGNIYNLYWTELRT